jgi:hypothetical protein
MIEFFIYTIEPAPIDVAALSRTLRQAGWVTHTLRGWLGGTPVEVVTHGTLRDDDSIIGYREADTRSHAFELAIAERDMPKLKQWVYDGQLGYAMWSTRAFKFSEHSEFESLEVARDQMGNQYADFLNRASRQYIVTNCIEPEFAASAMGAVALLATGLIEDPQAGICIPAPANVSEVADFLTKWPT